MMLSAHFDQKSLRVFTDPEARESGQSRDGGGVGGGGGEVLAPRHKSDPPIPWDKLG